MARTKLSLTEVRIPIKRERAVKIKAKLDDVDDFFDAIKSSVYAAAGAINKDDEFVQIDATAVGMAMTLANGTVTGQQMHVILRSLSAPGKTVIITPTALTAGTTWTLSVAGQRGTLIWVGAAWTLRAGFTGVKA